MPLLLLSGLPSSGKTLRATQLATQFQSRITASSDPYISSLSIIHIHDPLPALPRTVFDASRAEKDARAAFASAIKRALSRTTIVIADGPNYIKGFRYQLFCEAKAVRTTNCVVQTAVPPATAETWNSARPEAERYPETSWKELAVRYEEPDGRNRWDAPLFVVPAEDMEPDYDAVWEALVGGAGERKTVRPNAATVLKKGTESGYLEHLEKVCGEVVREVEEWGRENGGGGRISVRSVDGAVLDLPVDGVKGPQLQRLRRQFVAQNRVNEVDKKRVGALFVDYLNDAFQD